MPSTWFLLAVADTDHYARRVRQKRAAAAGGPPPVKGRETVPLKGRESPPGPFMIVVDRWPKATADPPR
jgi:hypothetical protein